MKAVNEIVKSGKKSLATLLREKAIQDVSEELVEQGIDPNQLSGEEFEILVAEKANTLESNVKSCGIGGAIGLAASLLLGI
ncbi:hypothetical protein [Vibrio sp. PNB22_4_1]